MYHYLLVKKLNSQQGDAKSNVWQFFEIFIRKKDDVVEVIDNDRYYWRLRLE